MTSPKDLEKTIERISSELELMQFLSNFDQSDTKVNTGIKAKINEKVWSCVFADCDPITSDFFCQTFQLARQLRP